MFSLQKNILFLQFLNYKFFINNLFSKHLREIVQKLIYKLKSCATKLTLIWSKRVLNELLERTMNVGDSSI